MYTLGGVFDKYFEHLKFNKELAAKIYHFQLKYLNSDREYLEFYGSNLLGVHRLRFKVSDYNTFMYDILEVDIEALDKDLDHVPSVVKINKVTSDLFNLSCVYLIHRFMGSNELNDKDKQRVCYDIASLFIMRCFAAYISAYFTYPAEERIVKIAYSNLTGNSLIKKLGNWFKVVDYRANAMIDKNGIHYKAFKTLNEEKVAIIISDTKDRVKDHIKNYYSQIVKVKNSGDMLGTIGSMAIDDEGVNSLVDRVNNIETKSLKIKSLIASGNFNNTDYIYLVCSMNKNTNIKNIASVVNWVSDNYMKNNATINEFIDKLTEYTYYLINNKIRASARKDVSKLLIELKYLYVSNRVEDDLMEEVRELAENIVKLSSNKSMYKGLLLSTRTTFILYIALLMIIN